MNIEGYMFVVPNRGRTVASEDLSNDVGFATFHNEKVRQFDMDDTFLLKDGDIAIQLWFHNLESDNWGDHGVPWEFKRNRTRYFLGFLPLRCIEHLREGDMLTFFADGHKVHLLAVQQGYRYERFGDFEDAVAHTIAHLDEAAV